MSNKYDVCIAKNYTKDGEEKTKWKNIGVAFSNERGMQIKLDSLPIPQNGECTLFVFENKDEVPF